MTTTPAPRTGTAPSLRALALVGRTVTDGVHVGVCRSANGPDWFVAQDSTGARLVCMDSPWASTAEVEAEVVWHGTTWTSVVPLASIRKGVTLTKSYGLPRA